MTSANMQPLANPRAGVINVRSLYSVIIALIPVIMIFNVPVLNIGFSTLLLGLFAPFALLRYSSGKRLVGILPFLVLFGYFIYRSVGSLMNQFLLVIVLIHVYGAIQGSLKLHVMRKTVETVAVIGTACVILQTLLYYVFGFSLMYLIPTFVLEENREILTRMSMSNGMYRPAAFFLEPSHYAQYCCIALLSTLFPEEERKADLKKALWIVFGCLLTTSGIGIALSVGVFGLYVLFAQRKKGTKLISLIGWLLAIAVAFFVLMQFDFFANALQRVFGEVDGYNAIWGRTLFWDMYIGSLKGKDLLMGLGVVDMPDGYMTGLMELIYCYGQYGLTLMIAVLAWLFIGSRNAMARGVCLIYAGLMCFADVFSFLSLTFWFCIILAMSKQNSKSGWREVKS